MVVGFLGRQIESIKANRILLKDVSVVGLHWGAYAEHEPETISKFWDGLFKLIADDKFRGTVFQPSQGVELKGINRVSRELQLLQHRVSWGKVVIDFSTESTEKL